MSKLLIAGGNLLVGDVYISGSKNAVLPILAATLLNSGQNIIHRCPNLSDVTGSIKILEYLGCKVNRQEDTVFVDSTVISKHDIPDELMRGMRSSVIFLGSILARQKKAILSFPGGCDIGHRPIDLHLKAFEKMGVVIEESHGSFICNAEKIKGAEIHLGFPSVGATENIMLLAVCADGTTVIHNAAKEPEVIDLQDYLVKMGAKINGAGSSVITIEGNSALHEVEHSVIPDRIETFTYLAAAAMAGGDVCTIGVNPEHLHAGISILEECGQKLFVTKDTIRLKSNKKISPINSIKTMPYPGFPTDMQAPLMAILTLANGTSIISETIFENRFRHVEELSRMGANIVIDSRVAVIKGVQALMSAKVKAMDLRGGAALLIACLASEGISELIELHHLERGYENFLEKFLNLGAKIQKVTDEDEKEHKG